MKNNMNFENPIIDLIERIRDLISALGKDKDNDAKILKKLDDLEDTLAKDNKAILEQLKELNEKLTPHIIKAVINFGAPTKK